MGLRDQLLQLLTFFDNLTKPSLKIRIASAIFWDYLGMCRDYGQKNILFRNKTFLFFKIESWNFQHLFEIEFHETSQNFNSIRQLIEKMKITILWGFTKFFYKQMLKVSAFYLEQQKSLFLKKIVLNKNSTEFFFFEF